MGEKKKLSKGRIILSTINLTILAVLLGSCIYNSLPEKVFPIPKQQAIDICVQHAERHNHMFQGADVVRYETFDDGGTVVELEIHHKGERRGKPVDGVGPYWCGIDDSGSVGPYENEHYPG